MKFSDKIKSYSFWVSLASAILLLVQTIGRPLGLAIDEALYMSVVNSVLGVFVVLGIVSHPSQNLISKDKSMTDNVIVPEKGNSEEQTKSNSDDSQVNVSINENNLVAGLTKEQYNDIKNKILNK